MFSLCASAVFADPVSTTVTVAPTDTGQSSVSGVVEEPEKVATDQVTPSGDTVVTDKSSGVKEEKSTSTKTGNTAVKTDDNKAETTVTTSEKVTESPKEETNTRG